MHLQDKHGDWLVGKCCIIYLTCSPLWPTCGHWMWLDFDPRFHSCAIYISIRSRYGPVVNKYIAYACCKMPNVPILSDQFIDLRDHIQAIVKFQGSMTLFPGSLLHSSTTAGERVISITHAFMCVIYIWDLTFIFISTCTWSIQTGYYNA